MPKLTRPLWLVFKRCPPNDVWLYGYKLRIINSLPCRDLNPGPPVTKQIAYQCATVLRWLQTNNSSGFGYFRILSITQFFQLL